MPKRIQLSRAKGWRLPTRTVKVDRTTRFGNPYRIGEAVDMKQVRRWGWSFSPQGQQCVCNSAAEAVEKFRHALFWDSAIHDFVRNELAGKDLACWCPLDQPCHADVLLEIAASDREQIDRAQRDVVEGIFVEAAAVAANQ